MTQAFCTAHTERPNPAKLSELRRKTDQQLLNLIHSKLDVGLSFTVLAEVERSAGDPAYAEQSLGFAHQALAEVQNLLPDLNECQKRAVDRNLNELRQAVHRLGRTRGCSRAQAASMS